jgi:hypothetical protein
MEEAKRTTPGEHRLQNQQPAQNEREHQRPAVYVTEV